MRDALLLLIFLGLFSGWVRAGSELENLSAFAIENYVFQAREIEKFDAMGMPSVETQKAFETGTRDKLRTFYSRAGISVDDDLFEFQWDKKAMDVVRKTPYAIVKRIPLGISRVRSVIYVTFPSSSVTGDYAPYSLVEVEGFGKSFVPEAVMATQEVKGESSVVFRTPNLLKSPDFFKAPPGSSIGHVFCVARFDRVLNRTEKALFRLHEDKKVNSIFPWKEMATIVPVVQSNYKLDGEHVVAFKVEDPRRVCHYMTKVDIPDASKPEGPHRLQAWFVMAEHRDVQDTLIRIGVTFLGPGL
jgi:hypothetical protein